MMGLEGINPWQQLSLLAIVLAIFGTRELRNVGGDLGTAMRDFPGAMGGNEDKDKADAEYDGGDRVLDQRDVASPITQHKQHDKQADGQ